MGARSCIPALVGHDRASKRPGKLSLALLIRCVVLLAESSVDELLVPHIDESRRGGLVTRGIIDPPGAIKVDRAPNEGIEVEEMLFLDMPIVANLRVSEVSKAPQKETKVDGTLHDLVAAPLYDESGHALRVFEVLYQLELLGISSHEFLESCLGDLE